MTAAIRSIKHTTQPFSIDKGFPIPGPNAKGNNAKYPWAEMEVGDSFVMDRPQVHASKAAVGYARRHGWKFATRKIDDNHTRVWRTA